MRDDLLDAQAAVDWAVAQIPILEERFSTWQRSRPYELIVEPDSDPSREVLIARQKIGLDPLLSAEAGAIINSARSALDLLAAALAARNGVKPSQHTHFLSMRHGIPAHFGCRNHDHRVINGPPCQGRLALRAAIQFPYPV